MKYEEVVEGMKVVPHSKYGVGIRPGVSVVWGRAQKMEQPYLFVRKKISSTECMLSEKTSGFDLGDFFLADDFEPYVAPSPKGLEPQVKKPCIIRNEQFSWVLYVDREVISFQGGLAADYFERHYKSLGYEVIVDRNYYKRNEE